ncbi:DEAD/DEAH box helicase [Pseudolysinimonas kribbensis]|uniref:DEAD/DEAH box helicase n=1 Tax=Pseudolysinimonas kribbensis TaxID=433641 RepID=A0ABQ6KD55_9MICO|nr:DEAD/DEAH box helicase [Pseudolysinimonas kribbensis]GMA96694.1 DEAD/DEAH box helicase [Pseudolysinimonas kribbensis]
MLIDVLPDPWDPDAFVGAFDDWAREQGLPLYPAQEEAVLELVLDRHLVLSTPTGTGKSLVAVAAHAAALAQGRRSWYTAPIKALVSEKFFQLVDIFGPANVGMITGDSSVNPEAPILCCTAEILANRALRHGEEGHVDEVVVMDEFHFYADPDRGWAWQVPLLQLNRARFVLMSATLGDVTAIADDLERRTGLEVAQVTGVERPVPLRYRYVITPIHETIDELLRDGLAPVYVVHFSQAAAVERAQALLSAKVATREQRDRIADEIAGFRFAPGFGNVLSRLIRAGIGVHHAGMLPKYRRLVEQLAQRGLLRVICGTDTLGVGINVPIRTVLLTGLTKFDGTRMRQLTAREFHQVAGRAGRAGFDTEGEVVAEAPEHEIENAIAAAKAEARNKKQGPKKRAPEGFVSWGPASFERLIAAVPETLAPSMRMTAAMMINVIGRRHGDPFTDVRALVFDNHEPVPRRRELARRAIQLYRTLRTAGVVQQQGGGFDGTAVISLAVDLPEDFALNQPLSPFALAAFELLDPASSEYPLDMISVLEATLDDPRPVLAQQQFRARGEAVAAMKAEGIEYDQRMELLEDVTWPKPLADLLEQTFETFAASQPWVHDFELSPKSVVRDLWEKAFTFPEFVAYYQLGRSEGLVLRYLSDAYRAARQTIPEDARTPELQDLIDWLGELVRQTDSSLLEEWEALSNPLGEPAAPSRGASDVAGLDGFNPRAFAILVRNELWRRVRLAALQRDDELVALDPDAGWPEALDGYYAEHDDLRTDADARSARMVQVDEHPEGEPGTWRVRQVLADPAGDHDWGITASVDLEASADQGVPVLRVLEVGRLGG